jgi:hypothetical protein
MAGEEYLRVSQLDPEVSDMSVLVALKVQGDSERFRAALAERADEFVAIADRAKSLGAIHHRFGIGDGFVLVVDEWESAEQFESFFSDAELRAFIASVGASGGPPEITVTEATHSPDEF